MNTPDFQSPETRSAGGLITIQITHSHRNRAIAKLIVILGLGLAFTSFYSSTLAAQREKAAKLTLESYTADFINYKARLLEGTQVPTAAIPLLGILSIAILAGSYELLVFLTAWILGKVLKP